MKSKLALLAVLAMAATGTHGQEQESPFTEEQKRLMLSVAELHNKPETVRQIFDYCGKQIDGFAVEYESVLTGWQARNQPFLQLRADLQAQVAVIAAQQEGMSPAELDQMLGASAKDIASAFAEQLEPEAPVMRVLVCRLYAGKVSDGEFDVGHDKPDIRQALEGYRSAASHKTP